MALYLQKSDEITISSYIADMIINSDNTIGENENSIKSRSDLIGKKINVTGCKYELSIVGIFNCDDLIDKKFEKLKKRLYRRKRIFFKIRVGK